MTVNRHVYSANRCLFCDVNEHDDDIYGPFECVDREPLVYTSGSAETFEDYVQRVDAVLDSPEVMEAALALKPTRKLRREKEDEDHQQQGRNPADFGSD